MDDQQRQPREGERNQVRDRIRRAMAEGRISPADGAIRMTNVTSAQSMTELGLMTRDLDQLEAALQPTGPVPQAMPAHLPAAGTGAVLTGTRGGVRRTLPALLIGLLVAGVAAGAIGLFAFSPVGGSASESAGPPLPVASAFAGDPVAQPSPVVDGDPAPSAYRLGAAGIRTFLTAYRERFSTTKVVDLTFYDDYVIVQAPVPGKARHSGWNYRDGAFSEFGGVMANFPGSAVIDTRKLDVAAVVRNLAKARRLLKVEDVSTSYVHLDYRPQFDDAPNVNIYLSNAYSESGYLATTLDGRVERAYPFGG